MRNRVSHPSGRRILWKFSTVHPDFAPYVVPFECLEHSSGDLNNFEWSQLHGAWVTIRVAYSHRIIAQCRRHGSRSIGRFVGKETLLTFGREWRRVIPQRAAAASPDTLEVVGIFRGARRSGIRPASTAASTATASLRECRRRKGQNRRDDDDQRHEARWHFFS